MKDWLPIKPVGTVPTFVCMWGRPQEFAPLVRGEVYRSQARRCAMHSARTRQADQWKSNTKNRSFGCGSGQKGIDPKVLAAGGRDGHRPARPQERAKLVGVS